MANSAIYHLSSFNLFRGAQREAAENPSWEAVTRKAFMEDIDQHLDTMIREYDHMLGHIISLTVLTQLSIEDLESGYDPHFKDKHRVAAYINDRFPFLPLRDEDPVLTTEQLHEQFYKVLPKHATRVPLPSDTVLTVEQFRDWRDLDSDAQATLCLEHFPALKNEHEHMRSMLALLFNRIKDEAGWGFMDLRSVLTHLGQTFWRWPTRSED